MKNEEMKNGELHYLNSLFMCRLDEVADNIEDMDELLFDKMKDKICNVIAEETFEEIFIAIDEYTKAFTDISHVAGMRFMLELLCQLKNQKI